MQKRTPKPSFDRRIEFDEFFAVCLRKVNADEFGIPFGPGIPIVWLGWLRKRFALKLVIEAGCEALVSDCASCETSKVCLAAGKSVLVLRKAHRVARDRRR